jgi:hypothetical protein
MLNKIRTDISVWAVDDTYYRCWNIFDVRYVFVRTRINLCTHIDRRLNPPFCNCPYVG